MPTRERPQDRGRRLATLDRLKIGGEIRSARLASGRSVDSIAALVGMSSSQVGRIERGVVPTASLDQLARIGAAVGLDIRTHAYPGPDPALDAGQLALLGRLRLRLGSSVTMRLEVPLPIVRDARAWDAVLSGLTASPGSIVAADALPTDADTRLIDVQGQLRRIQLKLRDSGMDAVLWVIADTARNRAALATAGGLLAGEFPVPPRRALAALGAGRHPGGSAIVVL